MSPTVKKITGKMNHSIRCRILDGLAFLPPVDIPAGLNFLKSTIEIEAKELVNYFDITYLGKGIIATNAIKLWTGGPIPVLFLLSVWSVKFNFM